MSEQIVRPVLLVESGQPESEVGFYVAASKHDDSIEFVDERPEVQLLEMALEDLPNLRSDDIDKDPIVRFAKEFVGRGWLSKGMDRTIYEVQSLVDPLDFPDEFRALTKLDDLSPSFLHTLTEIAPLVRVQQLADYLDAMDIHTATADGYESGIDFDPDPPAFTDRAAVDFPYLVDEVFAPDHVVAARARAIGCTILSWQYAIEWVDTARGSWPIARIFPSGGFAVRPVLRVDDYDEGGAFAPIREVRPDLVDLSRVYEGEIIE